VIHNIKEKLNLVRQFKKILMFNKINDKKEILAHIVVNLPLTIKDLVQIVKEYEIEDYHVVMDALEQLQTRLGRKNAEKLN